MTDRFEQELRAALGEAVSRIASDPDALSVIRTRISARGRPWRRAATPSRSGSRMLRVGAGLAAASAVALAVGIGSATPSRTPSLVPAATGSGPPPAAASDSPVPSGPVIEDLTVYYVGGPDPLETGDYPLYREVHQATLPDGSAPSAVGAALRLALTAGTADDPDYRTTWPGMVRVQTVSVSGGIATVDLSDVPPAPTGTELQTKLRHAYIQSAIQQLVWTATAYPGVAGVRLLFDGQIKQTLWDPAFSVGGVLVRGDPAGVLAPIWITDPQQNTAVAGPVTISVAGFQPLGVIRVTIAPRGVKPVATIPTWTVTLGAPDGIPGQQTASKTFTLVPGAYTVSAAIQYTIDKHGPIVWDDHTFTVW